MSGFARRKVVMRVMGGCLAMNSERNADHRQRRNQRRELRPINRMLRLAVKSDCLVLGLCSAVVVTMSHHVRTATVAHHDEDQPRQDDKIEDILQKLHDTKLCWGISIAPVRSHHTHWSPKKLIRDFLLAVGKTRVERLENFVHSAYCIKLRGH